MSFDKVRNYPDLGPRFAAGEKRAKEDLLRKAYAKDKPSAEQAYGTEDDPEDLADLSWATVLKRTFEAYIRGERPNMYGEWIRW
jgi:WD repeat and SOF domain-containing protein 1